MKSRYLVGLVALIALVLVALLTPAAFATDVLRVVARDCDHQNVQAVQVQPQAIMQYAPVQRATIQLQQAAQPQYYVEQLQTPVVQRVVAAPVVLRQQVYHAPVAALQVHAQPVRLQVQANHHAANVVLQQQVVHPAAVRKQVVVEKQRAAFTAPFRKSVSVQKIKSR